MNTHDPRKILDMLRNHLSQPETNVSFLLGAGTSCSVRVPITLDVGATAIEGQAATRSLIPNVAELTTVVEKEIRRLDPDEEPQKKFGLSYDSIIAETQASGRPSNIEDILSSVRRKLHAIGDGDTLSGLSKPDLALLEKTIQRTIAAQVNPDRTSFPDPLPHEEFVRWIARMPRAHPVEIFTTNYDVLVETALEAERVPAFDGFVGCNRPFFSHESLTRPESAPGSAWARLWKIHGSINWKLDNVRGRTRVIRTTPHNEGEMILPSHHKYDESRKQPYSALLERLTRVLDREDTILFVCGYSFSDDHINAIIFDALEAKRRPHVVALQYADPDPQSILTNRANRFLNLMVLGPSRAHIAGRLGQWKLEETRSAAPLAQAFEMDQPTDQSPPSGTGKFLLGDFARFAAFLGALTSADVA
jgi:hypothetical protein